MRQFDIGSPEEIRSCPMASCKRVVGPYFEATEADEAMLTHVNWVHYGLERHPICSTATDFFTVNYLYDF